MNVPQRRPDSSLPIPSQPEAEALAPEMPVEDFGTSLRYYWYVVWRRKWAICSLVVAVGLFAVVLAASMQPYYRSSATLLIGANEGLATADQRQRGASPDSETYRRRFFETQIELIRSRETAQGALSRLRQKDPSFDPTTESRPSTQATRMPPADEFTPLGQRVAFESALSQHQATAGAFQKLLPFDWRDWIPQSWRTFDWRDWIPGSWRTRLDSHPIEVADADPDRAVLRWLSDGLSVDPIPDTSMLRVSFEAKNPQMAARVANAVAEAYIGLHKQHRLDATQQASEWLRQQLDESEKAVDKSIAALQTYRAQAGLVTVQGMRSLYAEQLSALTAQVAQARSDRMRAQSVYEQAKRLLAAGRGESIPAALQSPILQQLWSEEHDLERQLDLDAARYTSALPGVNEKQQDLKSVRAQIKDALADVVNSIKTQYEMALDNEKQLEDQLSKLEGKVSGLNDKEFKAEALQRIVDTQRQSHDAFLQRLTEMGTLSADTISQIARIVDYASPSTGPSRPKKIRIVALAVILALGGGIGLAFLLDTLDSTLRTHEDVELRLGLPVLATVPLLKKRFGGGPPMLPGGAAAYGPHSSFAESIRTLRTVVALSERDRIVVVTSTMSGEGKSTVAFNLALAQGQLKNVLFIEADLRRPNIAERCGLRPDCPGVVDLIAGDAPVAECIQRVRGDIHVMVAGSTVADSPLEILSSERFSQFLRKAAEVYDTVVIDSAPAASVSDARVLAAQANSVIYIIKADSTPYQAVRHSLNELSQVGTPIVGAVLNGINLDAMRYGGYGGYHGYAALQYGYYGYGKRA